MNNIVCGCSKAGTKDCDTCSVMHPELSNGVTVNGNPKKKTKELDFNDKLYDIWFESLCNGNYQMFQKKIKEMFTQQRTELLEEINKEVIGEDDKEEPPYSDDVCGRNIYVGNIAKNYLRQKQRENLVNLLNKKDE